MTWPSLRSTLSALLLIAAAFQATGQQGRSGAELQIELEHASVNEKLARQALTRQQALARDGLLSDAELRKAEAELRLAELETMRARINYSNELPSFRIVGARKMTEQNGEIRVGLELIELPRIDNPGVRQYLISLRGPASIIAEPYEAELTLRGASSSRQQLTFRMLKDVDEVTVVIASGTRREEIPILLQHAAGDQPIAVRAQNYSQEAALDDKADYTLSIERSAAGPRDLQLGVQGLPEQMTCEWIDVATKAKLSSFRFADGQNAATVMLRVYVPLQAGAAWFGHVIPFHVRVREGERVVGSADLQLKAVGAPKLALTTDNLLVDMDRGETRTVAMHVENSGGVAARDVRIETDLPVGIDATIEPPVVPVVEPGGKARIVVRFVASRDAIPGDYSAKVRATAVTKLANIDTPEQSFRITLRAVRPWTYAGFAAPLLVVAGAVWLFVRRRRNAPARVRRAPTLAEEPEKVTRVAG